MEKSLPASLCVWQTTCLPCSLLLSISIITIIINPSLCLCKPLPCPHFCSFVFLLFFFWSVHRRRSKSEGIKRENRDLISLLLVLLFLVFFGFSLSFEHFVGLSSLQCKYTNIIHQVALLTLQPGQLICYWGSWLTVWKVVSVCVCVFLSEGR